MRTCFLVSLLIVVISVPVAADDIPAENRFRRDVLPILRDRCLECHGKKARGDLRIDSRAALHAGGASGPVIVPGDANSSELLHRVLQPNDSDLRMPPQGSPLSAQQIDLLRQWIDDGAAWPDGLLLDSIESRAADHWAFQPVRQPVPPLTDDSAIVRNPIDAFVAVALKSADLSPLPEADRVTLLRRVTLDLTGLPPTTDQIDEFLQDQAPDSYERAVDRLLNSPRYGERWARPWLDLCHFADTDGYLTDQARPVAWRYRQWLINALNQDLPFDQFTIQQLAGDLLPDPTVEQLLATGFLRNTLSNREGGADLEEFRVEQVVDRTTIVGTGWLGLTVGCARCHDHKYDPISQQDFFSLYAILDQADEVNITAPLPGEQSAFLSTWQEYRRQRDELIAPIRDELGALQFKWEDRMLEAVANPGKDPLWDRQWEVLGLIWGGHLGEGQLEGCVIVQTPRTQRSQDEYDRLQDYFLARGSLIDPGKFQQLNLPEVEKKLAELRSKVRWPTRAPAMRQARIMRPVFLHERGDFRVPGERVSPAVLTWLFDPESTDLADRCGHGHRTNDRQQASEDAAHIPNRLDLARWLVSPENPLTPRVIVNRMWQEFFGRGLVDPVNDFGLRGQLPSHPELLDWLAGEFIRLNWSMKRMHRLIVTSSTYRRSSRATQHLLAADPHNRWLARQMPLRFSADQVRDVSLFVGGLLDDRIGGPSVFPPQPETVAKEGFSNEWKTSTGADRYRRNLYTWIQRLSPYSLNVTFDAPPANSVCTARIRTNSPLQALTLLNDPVHVEAADALAEQLLKYPVDSDEQRIILLVKRTLSRAPTASELQILTDYLHQARAHGPFPSDSPKGDGDSQASVVRITAAKVERERAGWAGLCGVVLNLHEFITRD